MLVLSSAAQGMGIVVAQGMGIRRQLPTAIHRLHMVTQLRPTGIPITDRGTIPATGTVVIMAEGATGTVVMGVGGKKETGRTRITMKKSMVILVVATVSLAFPRPGHAWGHGYGWYAPGAFVGGALCGVALARPSYAYPGTVPDRSSGYQGESPQGEWVTVPGQYVGGTWVPEHRVHVPAE